MRLGGPAYLPGDIGSSAAYRPPSTLALGQVSLQPTTSYGFGVTTQAATTAQLPSFVVDRSSTGVWPRGLSTSASPLDPTTYQASGSGLGQQMDGNRFRPTSVGVPLTAPPHVTLSHFGEMATSTHQPPRQPDYLAVNPYLGELSNVRQLLGLSPYADSNCVQRTLAALVQGSLSLDDNHGQDRPELAHRPSLLEDRSRVLAPDARAVNLTSYDATRHSMPDPYRGESFNRLPQRPTHFDTGISNVAKTSSTLCSTVRKWNLRFDGKRNAVSFLERLEELCEAYSLTCEEVLKALPELLQGQALLWYRNNRDVWFSFSDFRRMFESQFFPPGYRRHLDDELRKRTQGETESFGDFVIALSTLVRRSGEYSNQQKLELVYKNMRPEYKFMIRRQDFTTLAELVNRAEEFEEVIRERNTFRPPPPASQALVPETAYVSNKRNDRSLKVAVVDSPIPEIIQPQPDNVPQPTLFNRTGRDSRPNEQGKSVKFVAAGRRRGRPRSPSPHHQSNRSVPSGTRNAQRARPVCWNCGVKGHVFHECRQPKVLRCYYCKREGVLTTRCGCRSGNANWAQEPRGHLSRLRPSASQPQVNGRSGSNA